MFLDKKKFVRHGKYIHLFSITVTQYLRLSLNNLILDVAWISLHGRCHQGGSASKSEILYDKLGSLKDTGRGQFYTLKKISHKLARGQTQKGKKDQTETFQVVMVRHFPNLMKIIDLHIQVMQPNFRRIHLKDEHLDTWQSND